MAVYAVFLRHRGSSQSKPIGAPLAQPVSTAHPRRVCWGAPAANLGQERGGSLIRNDQAPSRSHALERLA
ncbi:MAG TPA: hypothetical protein VFI21_03010 [Nocardioides sp.]|nr:hypothetical protein [Nocardioides sp.]